MRGRLLHPGPRSTCATGIKGPGYEDSRSPSRRQTGIASGGCPTGASSATSSLGTTSGGSANVRASGGIDTEQPVGTTGTDEASALLRLRFQHRLDVLVD